MSWSLIKKQRQCNRANIVLQQMMLEQLDIYIQKKKKEKKNLDTDLKQFTKVNSKWTTDLNIKCKTIKLLEDNIDENLGDLEYHADFLDKTPNAWSMKEIIDKLDFIKIKNFCSAKDNVKRMKRQPTDWEKIFTNDTDKGLLSKLYKELLKLYSKETNNLIEIGVKVLNRHLTKEDIEMVNNHMKRCSTSWNCKLE